VAREREQGTFDQLLVTPFRPFEILVGKALPGFFIGLFEGTLILSIAVFWFRVPFRGSLLLLYAGLAVYLLSTIGVGLMISSMAATMQQGLLGGFLFMVPAITLSGFTTPIANMPMIFQKLTLLNPMRYFLVIIHGVFLQDVPASVVLHQLWPMALIGIATMTLAAFLFRRRLY
jgi:ABC-2 type transport system permease protein